MYKNIICNLNILVLYLIQTFFFSNKSTFNYNNLRSKFILNILRIEISDAYKCLRSLIHNKLYLSRRLYNLISIHILNNFFNRQMSFFRFLSHKESSRSANKIRWLLSKSTTANRSLLSINYYCVISPRFLCQIYKSKLRSASQGHPTSCTLFLLFSLSSILHFPSLSVHCISVDPAQFSSQRQSEIFSVRDGWFIHLSSVSIPQEIQGFLQLRATFSLPFHGHSRKHILDFIKHFESNLNRLHPDISTDNEI